MKKQLLNVFSLSLLLLSYFVSNIAYSQEQNASNKWEKAIQNFEEKDAQKMPEPGKILFIGSSSITIWKDIEEYFPGKKILNRGFGGSQTSDILTFKERLILPYKPSQVVIYVGENDIAANKSPKEAAKDGKTLIKWILKHFPESSVAYISLKPSLKRWELKDKMQETNTKMSKYASKKSQVDFINIWDVMLGENGEPLPNIFLKDGLHMNENGYALWKKEIEDYLR
ncbi:GDSL-type esterase/lipase family protein [Flexithrix dorotheae]|uniref:GDSL-type esterase/lipase family protein n=1 Tax=Flexithrix dorotheae TaxID=70993 RepID=UPI00036780EF|nr:GDSL-type esterase/lipase family protein [Flexithrix dorotheae]